MATHDDSYEQRGQSSAEVQRRTVTDPETHFRIVASETSVGKDGYRKGEPKALRCAACGAELELTREPSAGVDELPHCPDCPQRAVKFEWWWEQFG